MLLRAATHILAKTVGYYTKTATVCKSRTQGRARGWIMMSFCGLPESMLHTIFEQSEVTGLGRARTTSVIHLRVIIQMLLPHINTHSSAASPPSSGLSPAASFNA